LNGVSAAVVLSLKSCRQEKALQPHGVLYDGEEQLYEVKARSFREQQSTNITCSSGERCVRARLKKSCTARYSTTAFAKEGLLPRKSPSYYPQSSKKGEDIPLKEKGTPPPSICTRRKIASFLCISDLPSLHGPGPLSAGGGRKPSAGVCSPPVLGLFF